MTDQPIEQDAEILSRQNDEFRRGMRLIAMGHTQVLRRTTHLKGEVVTTIGVHNMTAENRQKLFEAVVNFNEFSEDNDPYGEHDFGAIEIDGETCFWKIDYYDTDVRWGSSDPANPDKTYRVLTIMLAEEY